MIIVGPIFVVINIDFESMTTIEIPISDDLIQRLGQQAIAEFLQKQMQLLRVQLLADKLGQAITNSGVDWEQELENARQKAWETL
jgi:hypothetical protein